MYALIMMCIVTSCVAVSDGDMKRAREIMRSSPLIDAHNDLPGRFRSIEENKVFAGGIDLNVVQPEYKLMTDIPRLKEGLVGGQIWSVFVSCSYQHRDAVRATQEQIDVVHQMSRRYHDYFRIATTRKEAEEQFKQGHFPSFAGIEGGHQIDNSLASLRAFGASGVVKYMTLTHNCDTNWAESCCAQTAQKTGVQGLSEFGVDVVREMNRIGMIVDLSHVATKTMHDALDASRSPVIFSHSNARALCDIPRNVPDDVLQRLAANGGACCVTFVPSFVCNASVARVADHIEHIVRVTGSHEHVCIGADFDGISVTIPRLSNVSDYPNLIAELVARAWSDQHIKALLGENVLRVIHENQRIAAEQLHKEVPGQATYANLTFACPSGGCRSLY